MSHSHLIQELLIKKNTWAWGKLQELAFNKTKELLTKSPVLTLFDPELKTIVSADTLSYGQEKTDQLRIFRDPCPQQSKDTPR